MSGTAFRGRTAIIGVGQSAFYKHGGSPDSEFRMTLDAVPIEPRGSRSRIVAIVVC